MFHLENLYEIGGYIYHKKKKPAIPTIIRLSWIDGPFMER